MSALNEPRVWDTRADAQTNVATKLSASMAAPTMFGAGLLAGCGVLLVQQVRQDAQEEENIRQMTARFMAIQRAYNISVQALSQAAHKQEERLLGTFAEQPQQAVSARGAFARMQ